MEPDHKHPRGLNHVWHAAQTAVEGLRAAWRHEDAFHQELLVAAIAIPVALIQPVSGLGKALRFA